MWYFVFVFIFVLFFLEIIIKTQTSILSGQTYVTYSLVYHVNENVTHECGAMMLIIIIIMMISYNARLIYPIGYSRRRCGATAALIRQPQTHPHNEEPEIRNRILWEGVRFLGVGGNRSARRKPTKAGMESANQIHIQPLASCIGERKVYEH